MPAPKDKMPGHEAHPSIHVPGTTSHTIASHAGRHSREGTLRYLKVGTGAPWSCCTPCARRPSTSATSSR